MSNGKLQVVRGRLDEAHDAVTDPNRFALVNGFGLGAILAEVIAELAVYDSLRSQIEAEVETSKRLIAESEGGGGFPFTSQYAVLARLQAIAEGGKAVST